jgi:hypothetical protein
VNRKGRLIFLILALLVMVSCGPPDDEKQARGLLAERRKDDITIGVAAPWATISAEGLGYWQGLEMALDEVNQSGGVLGRKFRFIKEKDTNLSFGVWPRMTRLRAGLPSSVSNRATSAS